jgi:DUF1365 family protein
VIPSPGLYVGAIRHRRFAPRPHAFTYSIGMPLLDIDRLPDAMRVSRLTSYNHWNWASFDERDHFGDPSRRLRDRLHDGAQAEGVTLPDGPVFLLTHLRYGGYVFNPISIFYCYDGAGTLRLVLAEVNNTYGGRHLYWLSPREADTSHRFRATAAKVLYVSPFMDVSADYEFILTPPGDSLVAHMNVTASADVPERQRIMDATLTLTYQPWTASTIRSALMRFPLMTTKVIAAIHWQALRLYLGGLPVVPRRVPNGEGERWAQDAESGSRAAAIPAKEMR